MAGETGLSACAGTHVAVNISPLITQEHIMFKPAYEEINMNFEVTLYCAE